MTMQTVKLCPLALEVRATQDDLIVSLMDGRTISAPLVWFPRLMNAAPAQLGD